MQVKDGGLRRRELGPRLPRRRTSGASGPAVSSRRRCRSSPSRSTTDTCRSTAITTTIRRRKTPCSRKTPGKPGRRSEAQRGLFAGSVTSDIRVEPEGRRRASAHWSSVAVRAGGWAARRRGCRSDPNGCSNASSGSWGRSAKPIVVVAAAGQELPELPGDVAIVRDPIAGRGPLQGLAAGLAALLRIGRAGLLHGDRCPLPRAALDHASGRADRRS